jgi:hypothetical protein
MGESVAVMSEAMAMSTGGALAEAPGTGETRREISLIDGPSPSEGASIVTDAMPSVEKTGPAGMKERSERSGSLGTNEASAGSCMMEAFKSAS